MTSGDSERWHPVVYTMINTVFINSIELSVSREPATKRATGIDYETGLNRSVLSTDILTDTFFIEMKI